MKSILLLMCTPLFYFSQTSLEEYNYMTKGYKIQKESGLDMKKGYWVAESDTFDITKSQDVDNFAVIFTRLYRDKDVLLNRIPAGTIVLIKRDGYSDVYLCSPSPKSNMNILTKSLTDISTKTKFMTKKQLQILSYYFMFYSAMIENNRHHEDRKK